MQYITTRSNSHSFSYLHALNETRASDGGFYVPETLPRFSVREMEAFALKNPNQAMAEILNLFFDCELNRWDVDFAAGRYPVRLSSMVRRIAIGELWHNVDWEFSRTVRDLTNRIRGTRDSAIPTGDWTYIAVGIGMLFGVFGELMRDGIAGTEKCVDVAIPSGDFRLAMACRYGRQMGLPIGTIVICCNENNGLWNLIRHGEMRTSLKITETSTPECDRVYPADLERLIHLCGGEEEVASFSQACDEGRAYFPGDAALYSLQEGIYVSVVSQSRIESTIPAVFHNHDYVFGPYSALCYEGLRDFRSHTGATNHGLILSHRGALCDDGYVARHMNIAVSTLHNLL